MNHSQGENRRIETELQEGSGLAEVGAEFKEPNSSAFLLHNTRVDLVW